MAVTGEVASSTRSHREATRHPSRDVEGQICAAGLDSTTRFIRANPQESSNQHEGMPPDQPTFGRPAAASLLLWRFPHRLRVVELLLHLLLLLLFALTWTHLLLEPVPLLFVLLLFSLLLGRPCLAVRAILVLRGFAVTAKIWVAVCSCPAQLVVDPIEIQFEVPAGHQFDVFVEAHSGGLGEVDDPALPDLHVPHQFRHQLEFHPQAGLIRLGPLELVGMEAEREEWMQTTNTTGVS